MDPKYNPLDPRSPYFPLTLSMMEENERGSRGPGPKPGCGCVLLLALLLLAVLLMSLH